MNKENRIKVAIGFIYLGVILSSCHKENESMTTASALDSVATATTTANVSFKSDVQPIFNAKCVSCHSPSGGYQPYLNSYTSISQNAENALSAIKSGSMPLGGPKLSDVSIQNIQAWINKGKLNN